MLSQKNKRIYRRYSLPSIENMVKTAPKKAIQKTAKATGDLLGNKITNKGTRISKTSPQSNPETNEEEILRERYVSPEQRQKIVDDPRLL